MFIEVVLASAIGVFPGPAREGSAEDYIGWLLLRSEPLIEVENLDYSIRVFRVPDFPFSDSDDGVNSDIVVVAGENEMGGIQHQAVFDLALYAERATLDDMSADSALANGIYINVCGPRVADMKLDCVTLSVQEDGIRLMDCPSARKIADTND